MSESGSVPASTAPQYFTSGDTLDLTHCERLANFAYTADRRPLTIIGARGSTGAITAKNSQCVILDDCVLDSVQLTIENAELRLINGSSLQNAFGSIDRLGCINSSITAHDGRHLVIRDVVRDEQAPLRSAVLVGFEFDFGDTGSPARVAMATRDMLYCEPLIPDAAKLSTLKDTYPLEHVRGHQDPSDHIRLGCKRRVETYSRLAAALDDGAGPPKLAVDAHCLAFEARIACAERLSMRMLIRSFRLVGYAQRTLPPFYAYLWAGFVSSIALALLTARTQNLGIDLSPSGGFWSLRIMATAFLGPFSLFSGAGDHVSSGVPATVISLLRILVAVPLAALLTSVVRFLRIHPAAAALR